MILPAGEVGDSNVNVLAGRPVNLRERRLDVHAKLNGVTREVSRGTNNVVDVAETR